MFHVWGGGTKALFMIKIPTIYLLITSLAEGWRDSETAEVDQCWSVVAGMGQWWSEVGAGVEQGRF